MKKVLFTFLSFLVGTQLGAAQMPDFLYPTTHAEVTEIGYETAKDMEEHAIIEEKIIAEVRDVVAKLPINAQQWQLQAARYLLRHYKILLNILKTEDSLEENGNTNKVLECEAHYLEGLTILKKAKQHIAILSAALLQKNATNSTQQEIIVLNSVALFAAAEVAYRAGKARVGNEKRLAQDKKLDWIIGGFITGMFIVATAAVCIEARTSYSSLYQHRRSPLQMAPHYYDDTSALSPWSYQQPSQLHVTHIHLAQPLQEPLYPHQVSCALPSSSSTHLPGRKLHDQYSY